MFDQSSAANTRTTRSLIWSLGLHVVFTTAIFMAGFAVKKGVEPRRDTSVRFISIPASRPAMRARVRAPKAFAMPRLAELKAPSLQALAPPMLQQQAPPIPAPLPALLAPDPEISAPAPAKVADRRDVFNNAVPVGTGDPNTSAQVRTGGFSNAAVSGAQVGQTANRSTPVASAGFGDAGIATAAGTRRSVSAVGFGDAGVAGARSSAREKVRGSGFGDVVAAAPSAAGGRPKSSNDEAVARILEKPKPVYTEEARRLQIQGEVQLEIVFRASGEIHILRVVRGLGHGLDENAADAARAIRFLPAKRDGRPVDSTAMVHIIFQLA